VKRVLRPRHARLRMQLGMRRPRLAPKQRPRRLEAVQI
jgi:hypothetical protein